MRNDILYDIFLILISMFLEKLREGSPECFIRTTCPVTTWEIIRAKYSNFPPRREEDSTKKVNPQQLYKPTRTIRCARDRLSRLVFL